MFKRCCESGVVQYLLDRSKKLSVLWYCLVAVVASTNGHGLPECVLAHTSYSVPGVRIANCQLRYELV